MYKHGAYGDIVPSTDSLPPSGVATLPVYVGTAPVHLLSDYSEAVNKPILVNSFPDCKAKLGYSTDWGKFTLCEAMKAHFQNKIGNIGPIILINVFDPSKHSSDKTASLTFGTDGTAFINDSNIILSSVTVAEFNKDEDFTVSINTDGKVVFQAIDAGITSPVSISYKILDANSVTNNDIIGGIDDTGKRSGIECVDLVYQKYNMVPTILAVPGFSHNLDVYNAIVGKCQKINGHWDAIGVADIDSSATKTISAAVMKKNTDGYISKLIKNCWPMTKDGADIYHMSTLAVVRMQQTDYDNDNTPYVSPSNKQIPITATCLSDGTLYEFDETQANTLNIEGITTAAYSGGVWKLWGPHMGNYKYGADIKPEDKFDSSIRMMRYLTNSFQQNYMKDVDAPFNRKFAESVLDDCQVWLNSLENEGKLLYAKIDFNETSNSTSDMVEGDFTFDISTTTTPDAKSLTFKLQYTTAGLTTLFGGD